MAWHSADIIGSGASFTGLGAASWGPNRIDVFATIPPNVVHRWYDLSNVPQGWSTVAGHADQPLWEPLDAPPGGAQGSPAVTSWGPNRLDVFVKSGDSQIYHKWYDPNNIPRGWSTLAGTGWELLGAPPGGADGSPAATSWGRNRLDVFVKNRDGDFYHRWYDINNLPSGWSTVAGHADQPFWEHLGTPPAGGPPEHRERPNWPPGSPAATTMGTNRLDIFVHARNDDWFVWHKFFLGDRWSDWERRRPGTSIAGDPTAASWGPGRTDIIWPQSSGVLPPRPVGFLLHDRIINYQWNTWAVWNHNLFPPFAISSWGPERLDLFGFRDGNILHSYCQGATECI